MNKAVRIECPRELVAEILAGRKKPFVYKNPLPKRYKFRSMMYDSLIDMWSFRFSTDDSPRGLITSRYIPILKSIKKEV